MEIDINGKLVSSVCTKVSYTKVRCIQNMRMARGSNFLTCPERNHFPLRNTGVPMRPRERH